MKKTLHRFILAALFILAAPSLMAQSADRMIASAESNLPASKEEGGELNTNFIQGSEDRFSVKLIYENLLAGKVSVQLTSGDGNVVFFNEKRSDSRYMRTFNMGNLPPGEYALSVDNGKQKVKKNISISSVKGKRSLVMQ